MKIIKSIKELKKELSRSRKNGKRVGFVPTMGALHEGHLSLLRASKKENDVTVLSIFINPFQFGPTEDFAKYPRPIKRDLLLAKKEKVDIIFYPSVDEVYADGSSTTIDVKNLTNVLCGRFRPGHFKGVATVVGKLLNIVGPDRMYLGQKDAQQVAVIKKMVDDLNFPVTIKTCKTIREKDGLALSSRNQYLNARERGEAPILYKALKKAKDKILGQVGPERSAKKIIRLISQEIQTNTHAQVQYIECVNCDTLHPLSRLKGNVMIALAVWFGRTRLIDNVIFRVE